MNLTASKQLAELLHKHKKRMQVHSDISKYFSDFKNNNAYPNFSNIYSINNTYQSNTYQNNDFKTTKLQSAKELPTIFEIVGYRKSKHSLNVAINYILENTNVLLSEQFQEFNQHNKHELIKDFNLISDSNNLKKDIQQADIISQEHGYIPDDMLKNRQLCHMVFSLPHNKPKEQEKLLYAMHQSFIELYPTHKFVIGVHKNTNNMHAHIILKTRNNETNKQLAINKLDIKKINNVLFQKCLNNNLKLPVKPKVKNLDKTQHSELNPVNNHEVENNKKQTLNSKPKLAKFYLSKAKQWAKYYKDSNFPPISANDNTLKKLQNIGCDEISTKSFLWLYYENKQLAIWTINNKPEFFKLTQKPLHFNLRKVSINSKKINPKRITAKDNLTKISKLNFNALKIDNAKNNTLIIKKTNNIKKNKSQER